MGGQTYVDRAFRLLADIRRTTTGPIAADIFLDAAALPRTALRAPPPSVDLSLRVLPNRSVVASTIDKTRSALDIGSQARAMGRL